MGDVDETGWDSKNVDDILFSVYVGRYVHLSYDRFQATSCQLDHRDIEVRFFERAMT